MRRAGVVGVAASLVATACSGGGATPSRASPTVPPTGRADVGGYELAYACEGEGEPIVVLEAGLGAAGIDQFFSIVGRVADVTRVCTYDRAGTGSSDPRPADAGPVTAGLMARELHTLLEAIGVRSPVVLVGFSYGGMPVRAFEGSYPEKTVGLVLLEASSEPEIPVYERLHAGPWIDETDRIDIHTSVQELRAAGDLGDVPLVVVTAELIEDKWLATVPELEARFQARLARLSSNSIHVMATGSGHFVHEREPDVVVAAIRAVVEAARSGSQLPPCREVFGELHATCVEPGAAPELVPATKAS